MAYTAEIAAGRVGEEDVSAQIDRLRGPLKTSAGPGKLTQLHLVIDRDENVDILGDCLACHDGTQERDAPHSMASFRLPHESKYGEQQRPAWLGHCRCRATKPVVTHPTHLEFSELYDYRYSFQSLVEIGV